MSQRYCVLIQMDGVDVIGPFESDSQAIEFVQRLIVEEYQDEGMEKLDRTNTWQNDSGDLEITVVLMTEPNV